MRRYPPEICDSCEADADDHWLTDRLMYCPHKRAIAWRGDPAAPWNIHRNAKPAHFAKALELFQSTLRAHCENTGLTPQEGDQLMTLVRKLGVDRGKGIARS